MLRFPVTLNARGRTSGQTQHTNVLGLYSFVAFVFCLVCCCFQLVVNTRKQGDFSKSLLACLKNFGCGNTRSSSLPCILFQAGREPLGSPGPPARLARFHPVPGFAPPVFNSLRVLQVTWDKDVFIKNTYPRLFVLSPMLGLTPGSGFLRHVSSKHAWRACSRARRVAT